MGAQNSTPKLKLTYHNGPRARAEPIRLMMAHKDIPYEYERIMRPDWVAGYKETTMFGQLPALTVDGRTFYQSGTICRYVSKLAGLTPEDPIDAAVCDSIFEFGMDTTYVITRRRAGHPFPGELSKEEFFGKQKADYGTKAFPEIRETMAKILGDKDFFTGDKPMYCDFMMFHSLVCALDAQPGCLDGFGSLVAFKDRMYALQGVKAYMDAEPWKPV